METYFMLLVAIMATNVVALMTSGVILLISTMWEGFKRS